MMKAAWLLAYQGGDDVIAGPMHESGSRSMALTRATFTTTAAILALLGLLSLAGIFSITHVPREGASAIVTLGTGRELDIIVVASHQMMRMAPSGRVLPIAFSPRLPASLTFWYQSRGSSSHLTTVSLPVWPMVALTGLYVTILGGLTQMRRRKRRRL
jgi:hypothetical protein